MTVDYRATMMVVTSPRDLTEAARLLRGVLAAVEGGELDATSGLAQTLVRRIEKRGRPRPKSQVADPLSEIA